MRHLRQTIHDVLSDSGAVNIARVTLRPGRGSRVKLHKQDYYEIIRPLFGTVCLHFEGGRQIIHAGELGFVRPCDRHTLRATEGPMRVELAAFSPSLIWAIGQRHPDLQGHLFWSDLPEPEVVSARRAEIAGLDNHLNRLLDSSCDMLSAEAFLLPLCEGLVDRSAASLLEIGLGAPEWLMSACLAAQDKKVFREGASGFARAAGRAHPHVCRVARRFLGMTPSTYINHQRMTYAARRLLRTDDSIRSIAEDCGLPNLSHFHKVFLEYHKATPLQFRKRFQQTLV